MVSLNPDLLGDSLAYWSRCVLGYLVDYRLYHRNTVGNFIAEHWITRAPITFHRLGDIYAFHCECDLDRFDLLERSVAAFDRAPMVFAPWSPMNIPRSVRFATGNLWVRVCGLPFEFLNMHVASIMGQLMGRQYMIEDFNIVPDNDYLRIRVTVYLTEPLVPGFFLVCPDGNLLWVQLRYEDIFKYCTRCGKIGHKVTRCTEGMEMIELNINRSFRRIVDRGFLVVQTLHHFTMFNLDLRAFPNTTRYTTSRVRLGNHGGLLAPADFHMERVRNIDLGNTLGGRVFPGMIFDGDDQPFVGHVLFQIELNLSGNQRGNQDSRRPNASGAQTEGYPSNGGVQWDYDNNNVVHPYNLGGMAPMADNGQDNSYMTSLIITTTL